MSAALLQGPAAVTPELRVPDPEAGHWLAQVMLRLRREVSWCWHQRLGHPDPRDGTLPPVTDACAENLDWVRYLDQKRRFLAEDPAGRYLSACIDHLTPPAPSGGYWARLTAALALDEPAQFVVALACAQRLDAGLAPVFATCLNDLSRPYPTLALAQRLWDDPTTLAFSPALARGLRRLGLHRRGETHDGQPDWQRPLEIPSAVAAVLAGLRAPTGSGDLVPLARPLQPPQPALRPLASRLAASVPEDLAIVPLLGSPGADFAGCAAALTVAGERALLEAPRRLAVDADDLPECATLAWLAGADLLLPEGMLAPGRRGAEALSRCVGLPLRCFLPCAERHELEALPPGALLPAVSVPSLGYPERLALLLDGLGAAGERLRETVEDCARRFRFQAPGARRVAAGLCGDTGLDAKRLVDACRWEAQLNLGALAQPVTPRFSASELVLPEEQARQFEEVARAMRALTRVHYQWGTARAWNESGLAVLFWGPPGTGKTMAAEALANTLGLEMFRIDLSQVVSKYIGETEKNLRHIFDAAERSDCILFFDEADALFGKRTEVRDAHDRYANIEVSYLLERMERFQGLAILASNRRKDLDEAFLRRLRYVIEFPLPGPAERERIWRAGFPAGVDTSGLDFRFLAKQFALAGGHIRSVIFNACLQAAHRPPEQPLPPGKVGRVEMAELLLQLKRELQKTNRAAGDEQFGAYAPQLAALPR
jgi:hypothetical protein